jgi:hypothetical protein
MLPRQEEKELEETVLVYCSHIPNADIHTGANVSDEPGGYMDVSTCSR